MSGKFTVIMGLHAELAESWASGQQVAPSTISALINMGLKNSSEITNIEDREELRYILLVWSERLARTGYAHPDIDIDTPSRRPPMLTSREVGNELSLPIHSGSVREMEAFKRRLEKENEQQWSEQDFIDILKEFSFLLPGTINQLVGRQKRTKKDVLEDMIWATENNVMHLREHMETQVRFGANGLKRIFVNAFKPLDLRDDFYQTTTRQNLLSRVQHVLFVREVDHFEMLVEKVQRDAALGAEHIELLSCVHMFGDMINLVFMFDFALWDPLKPTCEGHYIHWDNQTPYFYPMPDTRTTIAEKLLNHINESVQVSTDQKAISFGPLSAKQIS